jgi:hypothetical protein
MVSSKFVLFNFSNAAAAIGFFMRLDKRLDGFFGMNGGYFFGFEVLKVVLDSSDMVFVNEIAEVIEGRLLR